MRRLLTRPIRGDFVVIDSLFPQARPYSFRNAEINEYLARVANASSYTMYPVKPGKAAWFSHSYGMTDQEFAANKRGYLSRYPYNDGRIHHLARNRRYAFKLAYSFFLAETYVLLPFFEYNRTPFVFVLYPGGAFGLDFDASDAMLRAVTESRQFRGVIVTQEITREYVLRRRLCPVEKLHYIYGGLVQFCREDLRPKRYYGRHKDTFDVCFVAAKYAERGIDKGYDLFAAVARRLCRDTSDIVFHVVGGFGAPDIDVSDLGERIRFYGYQGPEFLREFYANMDIFLSPNRPYQLFPGSFDGFPLGIDAAYCGVALFVADELAMNRHYGDGSEIVIVPLDAGRIAERVMDAYLDPEGLYGLADRGRAATQRLFDPDHQVKARIEVFSQFVDLMP